MLVFLKKQEIYEHGVSFMRGLNSRQVLTRTCEAQVCVFTKIFRRVFAHEVLKINQKSPGKSTIKTTVNIFGK